MTAPTVRDIVTSLGAGDSQPSEWTSQALAAIEANDEPIGAFLTVDADRAMAQSKALDGTFQRGTVATDAATALLGVPYALKDNICTKGMRTTAASKILSNYIPPYQATVAEQLRTAGGVLLGKTNLDEFAMGGSTENSAYQKTRNPYRLDCVPGG